MAAPSVKLVGGHSIPVVGLGTSQPEDEKVLEEALNVALENGYRHIDTAFFYKNEHVIGRILQKWLTSGKVKREDLFITTKLPTEALHPDKVETYLKKSLDSLQLDYVDLYLIHFPVGTKPISSFKETVLTEPTDHIAIWRKLEEQVDAGRTRTIGISNFNIRQVERIVKNARIKPASLQIENHVFLQQNELVKVAQDNGIVVVAYSPVANPNIGKMFARLGLPVKELPTVLTNPVLKSIAEKHKKSSAQIALKFQLQRNIVVIPRSISAERIKENINLFDFTLDEDDLSNLRGLEVGPAARIIDFSFAPAIADHPEWPFAE